MKAHFLDGPLAGVTLNTAPQIIEVAVLVLPDPADYATDHAYEYQGTGGDVSYFRCQQ